MFFEGKSSFDVTLGVMGSSDASRNFRFAPVAPTKPECKEEKVAMCEFGDFGQRAAYQDPDSFEQVPAKNIYARCLCAKQEETVAEDRPSTTCTLTVRLRRHPALHQGCPFPTLAEEMAHTFADDELNWLPDECLWIRGGRRVLRAAVQADEGRRDAQRREVPGQGAQLPEPERSGTPNDNALIEYNSYRKGAPSSRTAARRCTSPGTCRRSDGFPFCDQDGADGASQFSYCVPTTTAARASRGTPTATTCASSRGGPGLRAVPRARGRYLIPNCDCARESSRRWARS